MKKINHLFLIVILFCFSCTYQDKEEKMNRIRKNDFFHLYEFNKSIKFANSTIYKQFYFHEKNSFCSKRIWLFDNNTFESEVGCENHSSRQYGKWTIVGDNLILNPFSKNKFNIFDQIEIKYQNGKAKYCLLKIRNKNNEPISDFGIIGYDTSKVNKNTFLGQIFMFTNEKGELKIDRFKYDSIRFITLDAISHKKVIFKNRALPSSILIKMNTNANWLGIVPTYDYNTFPINYKMEKGTIKGWEAIVK